MSLQWDPKDPNEVLDYDIDWSQRLNTGDVIASSTWAIVGPDQLLIIDSSFFSASATKVWLSGGAVTVSGAPYRVRNRIVTTGGRTYDQTVSLRVREK